MARCRTQRQLLCASVLIAMTLAGCGASEAHHAPRLQPTGERRLLELVAEARADVSRHDGTAARAALSQFISSVGSLRAAGQLTAAAAGRLERQALTAGRQAADQLRSSASAGPTTTTSITAATDTAPASASPTTVQAQSPTAGPPATGPGQESGGGGGNPHPGGPPGQQRHGPPGKRQGHHTQQGHGDKGQLSGGGAAQAPGQEAGGGG